MQRRMREDWEGCERTVSEDGQWFTARLESEEGLSGAEESAGMTSPGVVQMPDHLSGMGIVMVSIRISPSTQPFQLLN
jgi:hypothetical protein